MEGLCFDAPLVHQQRPLHNSLLPEESDDNSRWKRGHRMRQANLDLEEAAATTVKTFGEGGRRRQVYSFVV